MRRYWRAWRVESVRLLLVSELILLGEDLVHPWSHSRNGCTCWYRCSGEALDVSRCEALVGESKGDQSRGCIILRGAMEALGTAILLVISICSGILSVTNDRGSIPAKVEYWEGLRIFSYVPTPTKLTNDISKTQLPGPKKGRFSPKIPQMCPFFCFWRVLAVFSRFKPAE